MPLKIPGLPSPSLSFHPTAGSVAALQLLFKNLELFSHTFCQRAAGVLLVKRLVPEMAHLMLMASSHADPWS